MANEATVVVTLAFEKGNISRVSKTSGSVSRTVTGSAYVANVQSVGTAIEALVLGDVGTPGLCLLHNLDGTNYVELFANSTASACLKLLAGDWQLVRFGTTTPNVKANTATCQLEYFLLDS